MKLIEVASGGKEAFEKFFRSALKKFGVSSPAELKGDKKKEFFDFIDKGFKSDKEEKGIPEQAKSGGKEEFEKFFRSALKKFGVSSPAELKGDKKKEFFDFIDKGFKSDKEEKGIAEAKGEAKADPKVVKRILQARLKIESDLDKVGKAISKVFLDIEKLPPSTIRQLIVVAFKNASKGVDDANFQLVKALATARLRKLSEELSEEEKGIAEAVDPKFRRVLGGLNILIKEVGKLEDGIRKVGKEAEIKDAPGQVIKGFNLALGNLEDAEAALQRAKRNIG